MSQPLDIQALRTPSPERDALLEALGEALDTAIEKDLQTLRAVLWYAHVHTNGVQGELQQSGRPEFPAEGASVEQLAETLISSYIDRAPGDGFIGRIRMVIEGVGGEDGEPPLAPFERLVQIGEPNHQSAYGDHGGFLPPPPPPGRYRGDPYRDRDPYGGRGGYYDDPYNQGPPRMPPMGHGFMGPDPNNFGDEMNQEERGMAMAMSAANERRLDMLMRQQQFLLQQNVESYHHQQQVNHNFLQLVGIVLQRSLPALDVRAEQGGGGGMHPLAEVAGGLLSSFLMGGGSPQEAPQQAPSPPSPMAPNPLPPQRDAYVPYEPPADEGFDLDPGDITEEAANEWAQQNPDAAKRVAKNLLPPAMKKLIPD